MSLGLFGKQYSHAQTPLVLAHRGASFDAPENTLAAFELAQRQGADGIELDTTLSRDGVPVVIHDLTLDNTTDGSGPVRDLDVRALKALDAGSHFDREFREERIPTLDQALESIRPDLTINIELKTTSWRADGLEQAVLRVIRHHGVSGQVIISSFNPFSLRRFRALVSEIPIGYLYAPDGPVYLRYSWLMVGLPHQARHPHHSMIDGRYMAWARKQGYRVHTWTVDDPDRIRELRDLGVNAIITNRPALALEALGRVSTR
jgi:glycerophosphoryl diester phosphodiesterase